jgi:hypothetical protein
MKINKILLKFSDLLIILSFLYLGLQIYTLIFDIKFWIRVNSFMEIFLGIFREICEILYIPLWGIVISFSLMFFNDWISSKNDR